MPIKWNGKLMLQMEIQCVWRPMGVILPPQKGREKGRKNGIVHTTDIYVGFSVHLTHFTLFVYWTGSEGLEPKHKSSVLLWVAQGPEMALKSHFKWKQVNKTFLACYFRVWGFFNLSRPRGRKVLLLLPYFDQNGPFWNKISKIWELWRDQMILKNALEIGMVSTTW